jgi:hypothetical protein
MGGGCHNRRMKGIGSHSTVKSWQTIHRMSPAQSIGSLTGRPRASAYLRNQNRVCRWDQHRRFRAQVVCRLAWDESPFLVLLSFRYHDDRALTTVELIAGDANFTVGGLPAAVLVAPRRRSCANDWTWIPRVMNRSLGIE